MITSSLLNDPILLLSLNCPLTSSEPSCVNLIAIDLELLSFVKLEGIAIHMKLPCQAEGMVLWTAHLEGVWIDLSRKHFGALSTAGIFFFLSPLRLHWALHLQGLYWTAADWHGAMLPLFATQFMFSMWMAIQVQSRLIFPERLKKYDFKTRQKLLSFRLVIPWGRTVRVNTI